MTNPFTSLTTYLRASRAELEKVTWPTREETVRYSILVTAVCVATAVFFATLDFGFRTGLDAIVTAVRPDIAATAPATDDAPIIPDVEPLNSEDGIEAVDEFGNPADVNIESIPADIDTGAFTVSPDDFAGTEE